jgi:hypothetical protein
MSTATFPAYAVLLHVNDEYAKTGYFGLHHIEPVIGDEPGAALKAYKSAEKNFLACRKHIGSANAYLVCMNLIAGPDTDLSEGTE